MPSAAVCLEERISHVWGPDSSRRTAGAAVSLPPGDSFSKCSFLPAHDLPRTKRHPRAPSRSATAQMYNKMYNKNPTGSSITDHASGTRLSVEFLYYNKRSGQCGNRNSNGLQMENYLMEQLSSKNVILSQSKCL